MLAERGDLQCIRVLVSAVMFVTLPPQAKWVALPKHLWSQMKSMWEHARSRPPQRRGAKRCGHTGAAAGQAALQAGEGPGDETKTAAGRGDAAGQGQDDGDDDVVMVEGNEETVVTSAAEAGGPAGGPQEAGAQGGPAPAVQCADFPQGTRPCQLCRWGGRMPVHDSGLPLPSAFLWSFILSCALPRHHAPPTPSSHSPPPPTNPCRRPALGAEAEQRSEEERDVTHVHRRIHRGAHTHTHAHAHT